jgi:tetratricopeptide (TPR) repeat protein
MEDRRQRGGGAVKIRAALLVLLIASPLGAASVESLKAKIGSLPEQGREKQKAALYSELGTQLYREGRMPEAAQAFEDALTHDTDRGMRRHIYLYMGKSYESHGRIDKAISAYEQAVISDRRNWRRHRDLAHLYEEAQLFRKAIASYQEALKLDPKDDSLLLALGRTRRKLGLYPEALPFLTQALDDDYHPAAVQEELSLVYQGEGRFEEAALACSKSLTADAAPAAAARLVYLSLLADDAALTKQGFEWLKQLHASPETVRFYENLVELRRSPHPVSDPKLQALLRSLDPEGKMQ